MKNSLSQLTPRTTGWRSLTVQLLTLIVLPLILIVLAVTVGSTTLHQSAMRDLVGARDERIAQMAAQVLTNQLEARKNAIHGLAELALPAETEPADRAVGLQALIDRSTYLDHMFDLGLFAVAEQGSLLAARGPHVDDLRAGPTLAEAVRSARPDRQRPVVVPALIEIDGEHRSVAFVLQPAGEAGYLAGGAFFIDTLAEKIFAAAFAQDQAASALLLGPGEQVLYEKGFIAHDEKLLSHPGVVEALTGATGRAYAPSHTGEHVVAYTTVPGVNWTLLIEEPWEQVANPLLETTHLAPLAMIPVMLLALLALVFGFRQIVRPLQSLSSQASSLGWGDYTAIEQPVGGIEEIRSLQLDLIRMARKVQAAQTSLHSYIGAMTTGQEEERRRLARELHDETIQSLIALKQRIQLAEMDWDEHPVTPTLMKLEQATELTIENVRRMVSALRPIYLEDLGLAAALDMIASELERSSGIAIQFERQGKTRRLDPAVELALYRIVQEALSNIARHSEATQASVTLAYQPGGISIAVADNGKGFRVPASPAEYAPGGHFGLLGVFERVELVGGKLELESAPARGTRLALSVPSPETS